MCILYYYADGILKRILTKSDVGYSIKPTNPTKNLKNLIEKRQETGGSFV